MGAHIQVEGLKAERLRRSLLVAMAVRWKEASGWGLSLSTAEVQ